MNQKRMENGENTLLIKQQCESTKQQQLVEREKKTKRGRGSVGNASTIVSAVVSAVVNPCVVLVIMKIHNLRSTKKIKEKKVQKTQQMKTTLGIPHEQR